MSMQPLRTPLAGADRPLGQPARHQRRQHDPQRRAADHPGASSTPARASCSGSSTATCSSSRACCSPPARSATASAAASALIVGLVDLRRSARCWPRSSSSSTELIASRALMGVGGAVIMPTTLSILTDIVPGARAAEGDRASGPRVAGLGRRHRPDRRRLADRALRLELDLPRQPAGRRRVPARGRWLVPESRDPARRSSTCAGVARCRSPA